MKISKKYKGMLSASRVPAFRQSASGSCSCSPALLPSLFGLIHFHSKTYQTTMRPAVPPPLSPYGTLQGTLFQYSTFPSLVAFESCPPSPDAGAALTPPSNKVILVGGLSDGLLPVPYTQTLEKAVHKLGWSLVQPVISSSYLGFGHGNLDRDTGEVSALMRYLCAHRSGETFAIVGHSTGCQNAVHFLKHGDKDMVARTKSVALQAPVSDREHAMLEDNYENNISTARKMMEEKRGGEMMPRSAFWAPITAARFLSLQDFGGSDDFFSSDLTDRQLSDRLGHVGRWGADHDGFLLAAFSGADEYVPDHVEKDALLERLCNAMNEEVGLRSNVEERSVATPLIIPKANHNLSKEEGDGACFVNAVAEQLKIAVPSL